MHIQLIRKALLLKDGQGKPIVYRLPVQFQLLNDKGVPVLDISLQSPDPDRTQIGSAPTPEQRSLYLAKKSQERFAADVIKVRTLLSARTATPPGPLGQHPNLGEKK